MAAPKGNRFWELRSKHGRDKIFASPDLLWQAACEYFEWCEDNPFKEDHIEKLKVVGLGDKLQREPLDKMRPFTMYGLCSYLDVNTFYFDQFEKGLKGKEDELSKDFSFIIIRIRETVFNQKFSGAAAGFLKENIIARELGISDKMENKLYVEQPLFGDDN